MKLKYLALIFLIFLLTVACAENAITVSKTTVYADASLSQRIGTISGCKVVNLEGTSGSASCVSLNGKTGYVNSNSIKLISDIAESVVFSKNSRVYKSASTRSKSVKIKKGTEVNLLATKGKWAMVEKDGIVAFTNKAHLGSKDSDTSGSDSQDTPSYVTETFSAYVSSTALSVYSSPSTDSDCLGILGQYTTVTVNAYNSDWAYIELNGKKGYAPVSGLTRGEKKEEENYLTSSDYTVEQKCYLFLVREMGFNTAAACGVLANIEKECDFNPNDASYDGGYGLIQWTGSRNTRLKSWCKSNGYDYTTVEGQMWYLKYELENYYSKTLNYMLSVSNTASGAYDAAYYWCYYFEIPSSRASRSVTRGNLAKNTYWTRYSA